MNTGASDELGESVLDFKLRSPVIFFHLSTLQMPTELPYAADAEMSLNYDELEVCRRLLFNTAITHLSQVLRTQYQKELAQNHVTIQTKFNYSWGLIKSPMRDHQVEGVRLLQGVYISIENNQFLPNIDCRNLPGRTSPAQRMSLLSSPRTL